MIMLFFKQDHRDEYVLAGPGRVTRKTTILMQRVSALAAEEPVPISELSSSLLLLIVFTWRPKDSKDILVNDCLISARSAVERTMCDFSTLLLSMSSPCWLLDNPLQPKIGNFNVFWDRVLLWCFCSLLLLLLWGSILLCLVMLILFALLVLLFLLPNQISYYNFNHFQVRHSDLHEWIPTNHMGYRTSQ